MRSSDSWVPTHRKALTLNAAALERGSKQEFSGFGRGYVFPLKYKSVALIKADMKPSTYKLTFIKSKCHLKREQSPI